MKTPFKFVLLILLFISFGSKIHAGEVLFNNEININPSECPSLVIYRDTDLVELWDISVRKNLQSRIFYEHRLELRKLKSELQRNLKYANTADGAYAISLAIKTTSDLIFDSMNVAASKLPANTRLIVSTYTDIRSKIDEQANNQIINVIKKSSPSVGAALQGINVFKGNIGLIQNLSKNGTLASTLSNELKKIDSALKINQQRLDELRRLNYVISLKNEIDRVCAKQPSRTIASVPTENPQPQPPSSVGSNSPPPPATAPVPAQPPPPPPTAAELQQLQSTIDSTKARLDVETTGEFPTTESPTGAMQEVRVARWIDPLTPPKGPKLTCVKEAKTNVPSCKSVWDSSGCRAGPVKYGCPVIRCENKSVSACVGHKYQWQKMECELYVTAPNPKDIVDSLKQQVKSAIEKAVLTAAIETAITQAAAAYATGGASLSTAIAQFKIAFLKHAQIYLKAIGVTYGASLAPYVKTRQGCGWTDWE